MANIFKEAKKVQRKHKTWDWQKCIAYASKHHKSSQTGSSNKRNDTARKAKAPGVRKSASGRKYSETRKNRSDAPGKLTGVSAGTLTAELRSRLNC